jgi:hypothetical protein
MILDHLSVCTEPWPKPHTVKKERGKLLRYACPDPKKSNEGTFFLHLLLVWPILILTAANEQRNSRKSAKAVEVTA